MPVCPALCPARCSTVCARPYVVGRGTLERHASHPVEASGTVGAPRRCDDQAPTDTPALPETAQPRPLRRPAGRSRRFQRKTHGFWLASTRIDRQNGQFRALHGELLARSVTIRSPLRWPMFLAHLGGPEHESSLVAQSSTDLKSGAALVRVQATGPERRPREPPLRPRQRSRRASSRGVARG